ncbi:MAG: DnaB-like helicase C-terminal domain-containing protein, partial [Actinomycetota bacterium]
MSLADAMAQRLDQARREAAGETDRVRIPTGDGNLNEYLRGGWRPTWLVGIAGAQKQGKTALATGFARASGRAGFPTLVISQEMAAVELAERELAARAEVPIEAIDDGPRDSEWHSLVAAAATARGQRFEIVDRPVDWAR